VGSHTDRVALVTGAASGIGRATAERVVAEGGRVVAVDLVRDALAWTDGHDRIVACAGDVTDPAANASAVALAVGRFGRLDALVLNAGIPMSGDLLELPIDELRRVLEVNIVAVVLGMRAVCPCCEPAVAARSS
jgi:NAD(P)-dependent dehydrogenase (short-subunit alcohol dehydrogenase family)